MIKLQATGKHGRPMYAFGLSGMNVRKLKEGKPIHIDLDEMGGSGSIMIFYGKTEKHLYEQCEPFVGPDTEMRNVEFDEHGTPKKQPVN